MSCKIEQLKVGIQQETYDIINFGELASRKVFLITGK